MPWSDDFAKLKSWVPNHGYQHFGTVSKERGAEEFIRLVNIYESVNKNGYSPGGEFGKIEGFF
ncbi:hypothetical protein [Virgibacillus tibetensis]